MLTYPVGFLGASKRGPLSVALASSGTTASGTVSMGADASDRYAVIAIHQIGGSTPTAPSAVRLGGVALSKIYDLAVPLDPARNTFWLGRIPSGNNLDLAITGSASEWYWYGFRLTGSPSPQYDASAGNPDDGAQITLRLSAGGCIVAYGGGDSSTKVWSGATKAYEGSGKTVAAFMGNNADASHAVSLSGGTVYEVCAVSLKP